MTEVYLVFSYGDFYCEGEFKLQGIYDTLHEAQEAAKSSSYIGSTHLKIIKTNEFNDFGWSPISDGCLGCSICKK
jgi:hypothetical protein